MKLEEKSRILGGSMPRWFRAVVAAGFALLFVGYALLGRERPSSAAAVRTGDALVDDAERGLGIEANPAMRPKLSGRGQFRVNGMLVRFNTYGVADPAAKLREFESALRKVGYRTRRKTIGGEDTVVAIHPRTKVMLAVAATSLRNRLPAIRLTQRNLSELKRGFQAMLPGIPEFPGARARILISSVEGPHTETLSYGTDDSRDWVTDFYLREMSARGWEHLVPPADLTSKFATLFFAKEDEECSILILPEPRGRGNAVLVTRTLAAGRS